MTSLLLNEIRAYHREQLSQFWEEYLRILNPEEYHVNLSTKLWQTKEEMIQKVYQTISKPRKTAMLNHPVIPPREKPAPDEKDLLQHIVFFLFSGLSRNCAASVDPFIAVVDEVPPEMTLATSSKYPVPTSR